MKRIAATATLLFVLGAVFAYGFGRRGDEIAQPVRFNHSLHLKEASLECIACHKNAQNSRYAGIPDASVCLDCHDSGGEKGSHPEKDKLFAQADKNQEIPWIRVAVVRPDVFFSHRRHVASAQIPCLDCHVGQNLRTVPPAKPELVMTMKECISCHEQKKASTDCLACHR